MREFKKGEKVWAVTKHGILKGEFGRYSMDDGPRSVKIDMDPGYVFTKHVYSWDDFGRATKFFKSRYGV